VKIVFLDFDGVLNSHLFMMKERLRDPSSSGGVAGIDSEAVARLNAICARTGARVVVSSSWRYGHPLDELREILGGAGFVGEAIDTTPLPKDLIGEQIENVFDKHGADAPLDVVTKEIAAIAVSHARGAEIDRWLASNAEARQVDAFVILDDDSDTDPHKDRHVKTSFAAGLRDEHVELAVEILGRPWRRTR